MNREQLEARKAEFTVHRANNAKELAAARDRVALLQATDNTLHGVLQDCEYWLAQQSPAPPAGSPAAKAAEAAAGATETQSIADAVSQAKRPALIDELQKRKAKREGAAA